MKKLVKVIFVNPGESKNMKLTTKGRMQTISTLNAISDEIDIYEALIITSPTLNALETALILSKCLDINYVEVSVLRLCDSTNYLSKASKIANLLATSRIRTLLIVGHPDDQNALPNELIKIANDGQETQIPSGLGIGTKDGVATVFDKNGGYIIEPNLKGAFA